MHDIFCLFDLVNIEEDVVLLLEKSRVLLNERFNEFGEQQYNFVIASADADHLSEQLLVFFFLQWKMVLSRL